MYILHVAVALSASDDNAIHYVLPVLWMASCFQTRRQIVSNTDRVDLFRATFNQIDAEVGYGPQISKSYRIPCTIFMKFYGLRTFHDDVIFLIWLPFNAQEDSRL